MTLKLEKNEIRYILTVRVNLVINSAYFRNIEHALLKSYIYFQNTHSSQVILLIIVFTELLFYYMVLYSGIIIGHFNFFLVKISTALIMTKCRILFQT